MTEEHRLVWTESLSLILSFIQTSYENWQEGEPNNYNNVENCVEMSYMWWRKNGEWNDLHCEDRKDWFCQIRKGKQTLKNPVNNI